MAKKRVLFPANGEELDRQREELSSQFIALLRNVVEGDEEARETLKEMLDVWDMLKAEAAGDMSFFAPGGSGARSYQVPSKGHSAPARELLVRIKLNHINVRIWREVRVPSNLPLDRFAQVLITAMGWMNVHMYQFRDGERFYCMKEVLDMRSIQDEDQLDMALYTVEDLLVERGRRVKFEYDFGDGWEHDVWLKGEREYAPGEKRVVACFKGQGDCPPEDCGGVGGYEELIALNGKKRLSREERERLEGFGLKKGFDPEAYDADYFEFDEEVEV